MYPGQELVIIGAAGGSGTQRILADPKKVAEIENTLSPHYLKEVKRQLNYLPFAPLPRGEREERDLTETCISLQRLKALGVVIQEEDMIKAGRGGVLSALWNLMSRFGLGCRFYYSKIPLLQGTVELCELYELNPYRLYAEECTILAVDHGFSVVETLNKAGYMASVFGTVTKEKTRARVDHGEVSYLTKEQKDELEKLFGKRWMSQ